MAMNGVHESPPKTLSSALINILGTYDLKKIQIFRSAKILIAFRYGGYDSPDWGHGVRNLLFHTPDPTASVETWIRLEDGETRARITLDSDYGRASPVNSAG